MMRRSLKAALAEERPLVTPLAHDALTARLIEDGQSPWLSPRELGEMGFTHVSFPASLIFRAASAMAAALSDLRAYAEGRAGFGRMANFAEARALMDKAVGLARWRQIESDFAAVGGGR